ncbi:hypothetical protein BU17DRAFT_61943 [Hysterangium stoloniferum]|nr:hypothetical protein BU17DRAFT_61943 [Hysterangium stoloniferum]
MTLVILGALGMGVVTIGVIETLHTSCVPAPRLFKSSPESTEIASSVYTEFFIIHIAERSHRAAFILEFLTIIFNIKGLVPAWLNNVTNALPLPIPAILISRFLLELRSMATNSTYNTHLSNITISFADIDRQISDDFGGTTLGYDELYETYPLEELVGNNFSK